MEIGPKHRDQKCIYAIVLILMQGPKVHLYQTLHHTLDFYYCLPLQPKLPKYEHLLVNHLRKLLREKKKFYRKKKKATNILIAFSISHRSSVKTFLKQLVNNCAKRLCYMTPYFLLLLEVIHVGSHIILSKKSINPK